MPSASEGRSVFSLSRPALRAGINGVLVSSRWRLHLDERTACLVASQPIRGDRAMRWSNALE